jgi:hypothetical protein
VILGVITGMNPIQQDIQQVVDRFVEEVVGVVQRSTMTRIAQALGEPLTLKQLPNRKSRRLQAAKTRPAPKELPKQLGKALNKIKKSKRPVTSTIMAKTLGINEDNARQVLAKLLRKKLVTTQRLGDGTARKVYLPSKS